MNILDKQEKKQEILSKYGVDIVNFNVDSAISERVSYLKDFIKKSKLKGFVLGISGGVDSTTAGRLAQIACEELRKEGVDAQFIAVRLPAGIQKDEEDAQLALQFIKPDLMLDINIGKASDVINSECLNAISAFPGIVSPKEADFHKGNIKARMRMLSQYYVAGMYNMAVISTDHNSEAVTGFFTKFGDGAADLTVLDGLIKTQVRMVAEKLGAPLSLFNKLPTADLEELNPGKLDDEGFGFPYQLLEDFLMGKEVDAEIENKIIELYVKTEHKRNPIVSFSGI